MGDGGPDRHRREVPVAQGRLVQQLCDVHVVAASRDPLAVRPDTLHARVVPGDPRGGAARPSADGGEDGKGLEQVVAEIGQPIGEHEHAGDDQQGAGPDLHLVHVAAKALEEVHEGPDRHGRGDERNPEPERVGRQQRDAKHGGTLARRDREDGRENRADAGRPAEGEGNADHERADQAARHPLNMEPGLAVEERDAEEADVMQPKNDDGGARDLAEHGEIFEQQRVDRRGAGPEGDEYRGESEHEGRGGRYDASGGGACLVVARQLVKAGARDEAQKGWHQRQHAGRQKTDGPGAGGGRETYLG